MIIRDAVATDLLRITEIYNAVLVSSTAVFSDVPALEFDRAEIWKARCERGYPTIVAAEDETVVGFASFGDFRLGSGYRFSVEHTVHVDAAWRGIGIGKSLVEELISRARAINKHVMIGAIDSKNEASLRFHRRLEFLEVARLPEVGYKFGQYLDLVLVEHRLKSFTAEEGLAGK